MDTRYLILAITIGLSFQFKARAELIVVNNDLRLSEEWRSFKERRKKTTEYETLKKQRGNAESGYDISICNKEKNFTSCDLAYCINKSKIIVSDEWLKTAQSNMNGTCNLPDIENKYRNRLQIVRECLAYQKQYNKIKPFCNNL